MSKEKMCSNCSLPVPYDDTCGKCGSTDVVFRNTRITNRVNRSLINGDQQRVMEDDAYQRRIRGLS